MAAFTDQKRALHDYIADTRVVYVKDVGLAKIFLILIFSLSGLTALTYFQFKSNRLAGRRGLKSLDQKRTSFSNPMGLNDAEVHHDRGSIYRKKGEQANAPRDYERARQLGFKQ